METQFKKEKKVTENGLSFQNPMAYVGKMHNDALGKLMEEVAVLEKWSSIIKDTVSDSLKTNDPNYKPGKEVLPTSILSNVNELDAATMRLISTENLLFWNKLVFIIDQGLDFKRPKTIDLAMERINVLDMAIAKQEFDSENDRNIAFIMSSVASHSILFWQERFNDPTSNEGGILAKTGGPERIAKSDANGAIKGAITGTLTGGPGSGTVVGAGLGGIVSSWYQFFQELGS